MPRPQNLDQCTVYHIRHRETLQVVYVGSTTNFDQRKAKHKYAYNYDKRAAYMYPHYTYIRENGGFESFEIVPILHQKCESCIELRILEQQEIDRNRLTIKNKNNAQHDPKQYRLDNKEKLVGYIKQYNHKYKADKAVYDKQYRIDNKEIIMKKQNKKIKCECGCEISKSNLSAHKKSKKHLTKIINDLDEDA
jgi:hypothetical protein